MKNRQLYIVEGFIKSRENGAPEKKMNPVWAKNYHQAIHIFQEYYESQDYKCNSDYITVAEQLDKGVFDRKTQREDII